MAVAPRRIVDFWLNEVGPAGWYGGGPALDARIRAEFMTPWRMARAGAFEHWQAEPAGTLALLILTDQFPRNMHRGSSLAFDTDPRARRTARRALARGDDRRSDPSVREFFYLPFMHSERLIDQELSCALYARNLPPRARAAKTPHARAHRAVIARFGRFPYRNDALGRGTTAAEADWLERTGYMGELRRLGG